MARECLRREDYIEIFGLVAAGYSNVWVSHRCVSRMKLGPLHWGECKLLVAKLVKKFPTFHGTRRLIAVLRRRRHWSLFWARWIHSTLSYRAFMARVKLHLSLVDGIRQNLVLEMLERLL